MVFIQDNVVYKKIKHYVIIEVLLSSKLAVIHTDESMHSAYIGRIRYVWVHDGGFIRSYAELDDSNVKDPKALNIHAFRARISGYV